MPWSQGQSGNPDGRKKERRFKRAIEVALSEDDGARVRKVVENLILAAENGEQWAIKELMDRVDGKPEQSVDTTHGVDTSIMSLLERIASHGRSVYRPVPGPEVEVVEPLLDHGQVGEKGSLPS